MVTLPLAYHRGTLSPSGSRHDIAELAVRDGVDVRDEIDRRDDTAEGDSASPSFPGGAPERHDGGPGSAADSGGSKGDATEDGPTEDDAWEDDAGLGRFASLWRMTQQASGTPPGVPVGTTIGTLAV